MGSLLDGASARRQPNAVSQRVARPACTGASRSSSTTSATGRRPCTGTTTTSAPISPRSSASAAPPRSPARRSPSAQDGLHLDGALARTEAREERVFSYVNSIPTTSGGAHENGLRGGAHEGGPELPHHPQPRPGGLAIAAEVRPAVTAARGAPAGPPAPPLPRRAPLDDVTSRAPRPTWRSRPAGLRGSRSRWAGSSGGSA
jgi:hypothetical protein